MFESQIRFSLLPIASPLLNTQHWHLESESSNSQTCNSREFTSPFNCTSFGISPKVQERISQLALAQSKNLISSITSIMSPKMKSPISCSQTTILMDSTPIETPFNRQSLKELNKEWSETFCEAMYVRVEEFLDRENLDIIEAETFLQELRQLIRLKAVDNSEEENKYGKLTLNCFKARSASSIVPMDVSASKLFQRRASLSHESVPKFNLNTSLSSEDELVFADTVQTSTLKMDKYRNAANKLKTLLSIDNCDMESDMMGGESPYKTPIKTPNSIFNSESFAQSLERLSPGIPGPKSLKFNLEKEGTRTPYHRSSPISSKGNRLRKGYSLCQYSDFLLSKPQ